MVVESGARGGSGERGACRALCSPQATRRQPMRVLQAKAKKTCMAKDKEKKDSANGAGKTEGRNAIMTNVEMSVRQPRY